MSRRIVTIIVAVIGSVALVAAMSGTAVGAATSSAGTTKLSVGAYAGGNGDANDKGTVHHDGNLTLSASDSDSGEDGAASVSATLSSSATSDRVILDGTAATSQSTDASALLYPASVSLDTTLGEAGHWAFAGSFNVTASSTTPDGCISGSVTVRIYPPGEASPSYNGTASVSSCTNGAAHKSFGDVNGVGVALEAGTLIRTSGAFSSPSSFASGTSEASFSAEVRKLSSPPISNPTPPPAPTPPAALTNTQLPTISGKPAAGKKLTASTGQWSQTPTAYSYHWLRNGRAIKRATRATYTVKSKDKGKRISVRVTIGAPGQPDAAATSAAKKVKAGRKK